MRKKKRKKKPQAVAIKVKEKRLNPTPTNPLLKWVKLLFLTGSAQIIVQATGFLSGILILRLLPAHEYALYTLANTMLGTMCLLADSGVATGVMSQGGKVWQDKTKLGAVFSTGMRLRKRFALFSLLLAIPILLYLLRKHDASWLTSGLVTLSLIPTFFSSLSGTLLEIPLKLHQDISRLQKIQVVSNIGRLCLIGMTLFVYPFAAIALTCASFGQLWSNWQLRKACNRYADRNQPIDLIVQTEIVSKVKRILPGAIYYCVSGQITIWLMSIFGSSESVAQIGALGRLAMILSLISSVFGTLIVPRFAKLNDNPKLLLGRFLQAESILIVLACAIVACVWFFPSQVLWILGKQYSELTSEVFLLALGSCITMVSGGAVNLCFAKGFIPKPLINIGLQISVQALILANINFSTLHGALLFSIFSSIFSALFWNSVFFTNLIFIARTHSLKAPNDSK
ncbi:MAG: hypothetical protein WC782_04005 [Methylococcaceae bacterium]|jgi:O-antigen/teichoic acid export membrane protein